MSTQPTQILTILLLWLVGLGAAAQFAKIAVPFATVRAFYPDAGDAVGWLLSIVSLSGAVLGIVFGNLVARAGEKRIIIAGLILGALMSLWQASIPSFSWMLFSRFLEGLSHLTIVVAAPTLITQLAGDRLRPLAMSFWSTFFGVAFAIFAWIVIPLFPSDGLGGLLSAHGIYMAVAAGLLVFILPKDEPKEVQATNVIASHLRAYTTPSIAAPALGWLFYTLTFVSLIALIPERLPEGEAAWATGLMPLMSIATSLFLVPLIATRYSSLHAIYAGFAIGAVLILFAINIDLRAIVAVIFFGVIGLVQGGSFASVPELNKTAEDQALAYGFMAQMGNVGNLLGTPILLWVISMGGDTAKYGAITLLYTVAIAAHALLARARAN